MIINQGNPIILEWEVHNNLYQTQLESSEGNTLIATLRGTKRPLTKSEYHIEGNKIYVHIFTNLDFYKVGTWGLTIKYYKDSIGYTVSLENAFTISDSNYSNTESNEVNSGIRLYELKDVLKSVSADEVLNQTDGSVLVYNSSKNGWEAKSPQEFKTILTELNNVANYKILVSSKLDDDTTDIKDDTTTMFNGYTIFQLSKKVNNIKTNLDNFKTDFEDFQKQIGTSKEEAIKKVISITDIDTNLSLDPISTTYILSSSVEGSIITLNISDKVDNVTYSFINTTDKYIKISTSNDEYRNNLLLAPYSNLRFSATFNTAINQFNFKYLTDYTPISEDGVFGDTGEGTGEIYLFTSFKRFSIAHGKLLSLPYRTMPSAHGEVINPPSVKGVYIIRLSEGKYAIEIALDKLLFKTIDIGEIGVNITNCISKKDYPNVINSESTGTAQEPNSKPAIFATSIYKNQNNKIVLRVDCRDFNGNLIDTDFCYELYI